MWMPIRSFPGLIEAEQVAREQVRRWQDEGVLLTEVCTELQREPVDDWEQMTWIVAAEWRRLQAR